MMIRTYSELIKLKNFEERYNYLRIGGKVGEITFGHERYLNQMLYTSKLWINTRDKVIVRDNGYDLGVYGYDIRGKIIVHHLNPITAEDIILRRDIVFDPEFLISTSYYTHLAIHFGDKSLLPNPLIERFPNDTCPWR